MAYEERLRAVRAEPESKPARAELAQFLHANDELHAATQLYEQLIITDTGDGRWPYYLARIVQDEGQSDRARTLLDEAEKRAPSYPLIVFRRAELNLKTGELDAAEKDYRAYLTREPQSAHARVGLARIAAQKGDWGMAESELNVALKHQPGFASARALLATVQESLGKEKQAARAAASSATLRYREPEDPWLEELAERCVDAEKISVLADIALESGRVARAIALLERSRGLDPSRARTHLELGKARLRSGASDAARERFAEAVRLDPSLAEAHHALAAAFEAGRDVPRALAASEAGVRANPTHAGLQRQRGILLQASQRGAEAEAALRRSVELDPSDVANVEAFGNFLWAEGRGSQAVEQFERARTLSRLATKPRALLGGFYLEAGELAKAEQCIVEAAEIEPGLEGLDGLRALLHVRRGNAAFRNGDAGRAEEEFRRALAVRRDHEEALTNLIAVWTRTKRGAEAASFLGTFIAEHPKAGFAYALAARVAAQGGDRVGASALIERGLEVVREQNDQRQDQALRILREQLRGPWQAPPGRSLR